MNDTERNEFKKKLEKIRKENLTEQECFEFFGGLNQNEIEALLQELASPDLSPEEKKQSLTLKIYLESLLNKITERN